MNPTAQARRMYANGFLISTIVKSTGLTWTEVRAAIEGVKRPRTQEGVEAAVKQLRREGCDESVIAANFPGTPPTTETR